MPAPEINITQLAVQGANQGNSITADEDVTVFVECANAGGDDSGPFSVAFSLSNGASHQVGGQLGAGQSSWYQWSTGPLGAGGYDVSATAYADVDQSTQVLSENGYSFVVEATAPPEPEIPYLTVDGLSFTAGNVVLPAGQANAGDSITFNARVRNEGATDPGQFWFAFYIDNEHAHTESMSGLAPGGEQWMQWEAGALEVGTYRVQASAGGEFADGSQILGQTESQLEIVARDTDLVEIDAQFTITNYLGYPLRGYSVFVQFLGVDGEVAGGGATVGDAELSHAGILTHSNIWIPRQGSISISAVSSGEARPMLEVRPITYTLPEGATALQYSLTQEFTEAKYRSRSMRALREQLAAEVEAGVEFYIFTAGGSVATEDEETREYEQEVEWTVRIASNVLMVAS